jgi:hypothetical protein
MMKVQYIADLLYNHECVIVPGFGGFLTSYLPARIDKGSNRFYPPSCKVAFNASLSANDGILANYIAKSCGSSYREALDDIRRWVDKSYRLLHSGERLQLEGIGFLQLNSEGNLQFEPESRVNFLGNSYGLPSFYAKAVSRENEEPLSGKIKRVQDWPSKLKVLLPETFKWAAVLAPFIAFTLWSSFNTGKISNYVQNYSGLFSWVRTTPGKTSTFPAKTYILPSTIAITEKIQSPAGVLSALSESYAPSIISYSAIRAKGLIAEENQEVSLKSSDNNNVQYYIVGGAFREHSNALKMIKELCSKGYPAAIIDTTVRGMYVVSIKGYAEKTKAIQDLSSIKGAGYIDAWIMRKS